MRSSNFELLRCLAMLMVIGLHANHGALGYPTPALVNADPWGWAGRIVCEQLCLPCVDVFVLITGWFGTHFKLRNFARLLFQVCFVSVLMSLGILLCTGASPIRSFGDFLKSCYNYWFIYSYLLLYLFTPMLNAWVEKTGERNMRHFVLGFVLLAFPCSIVVPDLNMGYSSIWFMGLYLLGRYLRLYASSPHVLPWRTWQLAVFPLVLLGGMALVHWQMLRLGMGCQVPFVLAYTNPLTLLAAVCLVLLCNRRPFHSRWVNAIAAGSLTAYLTHQQIFVRPYFFSFFRSLHHTFGSSAYWAVATACILAIFLLSAALDYLRQWAWQWLCLLCERMRR